MFFGAEGADFFREVRKLLKIVLIPLTALLNLYRC